MAKIRPKWEWMDAEHLWKNEKEKKSMSIKKIGY